MKNTLLLLSVFLLVATSCRHTVKEYYPHGELRSAVECKGKVPDGLSVYYDKSGVKSLEVEMVKGKKEGR